MQAHIVCENVWKVFGSEPQSALTTIRNDKLDKVAARDALNHILGVSDVSLQINRGEIFCIMGLSGSGKSTLLRHVNRLVEPTAGRITIDGVDTSTMDDKTLSKLRSTTIGMVFQHMALWPHRTLWNNVAYGLEVQGVGKQERRRIALKTLAMMQLEGWADHYPDQLSGGMQQRVGLARALAPDPEILLMDEPFSALDPLIRRDLQTQFMELSKRMRKTTIFVTHDLEEAIRLGDRIAIMKDGKLMQVGTREEIILHPANEYIANFVKPMARVRFLNAENLMVPLIDFKKGNKQFALPDHSVPWDANLKQVSKKLALVQEPISVIKNDDMIGVIEPYSLIDSMSDFESEV